MKPLYSNLYAGRLFISKTNFYSWQATGLVIRHIQKFIVNPSLFVHRECIISVFRPKINSLLLNCSLALLYSTSANGMPWMADREYFSHGWKWKTFNEKRGNHSFRFARELLIVPKCLRRSHKRHLPRTVRLVAKTLGGCVDTWHMYMPPSSFLIGLICRRQLFGYWNFTLILGSPLYVLLPTVSRDTLSVVLLIHITWYCRNWGTAVINSGKKIS